MNGKVARKIALLVISIVNAGLAVGVSSIMALNLKVALEEEKVIEDAKRV